MTPSRPPDELDAVVVGASIAGCTTARLLALRGATVALVEKRPDPAAYKTVCTHFIQASATPVIEKLGLAERLDEKGAIHNGVDLWTPYAGWIDTDVDEPYGFNVTRRTLDPVLRDLAAQTPGVTFLPGETVTGLATTQDGRANGVTLRSGTTIRARLTVGADGRGSKVAALTNLKGRVRPHNRFFYWAYWRGVQPATTRSKMWLLDPDCAYTFPMEDGLTLVLVGPHKDRLPEFREDLEGAYLRMLEALPDGPDLTSATRKSKLLGKLDSPNVLRPAAKPGLALAGDAALASDPLWGIGCGWAFQSADWLADHVAPPLANGASDEVLDEALARYRRTHFRRLALHHLMILDYSSGRHLTPFEKLVHKASARDPEFCHVFAEIGSRRRSPALLLRPDNLARLVRAGATR